MFPLCQLRFIGRVRRFIICWLVARMLLFDEVDGVSFPRVHNVLLSEGVTIALFVFTV